MRTLWHILGLKPAVKKVGLNNLMCQANRQIRMPPYKVLRTTLAQTVRQIVK